MTLKEATTVIGFIKALPSFSNLSFYEYRLISFRQINNFIELVKILVDEDSKKLEIFKEKITL